MARNLVPVLCDCDCGDRCPNGRVGSEQRCTVLREASGEPEKRLTPSPFATQLARVLLLERAAKHVGGQAALATALGIQERSLRAKFSVDRGVTDQDLERAAQALDAQAALLRNDAVKMRALIA